MSNQLLNAAAALARHNMDGLRLFRPTAKQEIALRELSKEQTMEALIVAGNRAGKSTLAAAFFASFVRDIPITTWDGEQIHCRPERLRGQNLNAWVIGDHLKHIGKTIYRLLFQEDAPKGLFKIIRDEVTGLWRAWEPERYPTDWDRQKESKWNPPVIPPDEIVSEKTSWTYKADNEFRQITLTNGAVIHAFASSAEVKQGDAVDIIWNDENIVNKSYYAEWLARLRDSEGMMVWSTIPRDECYIFNEVYERVENIAEEIDRGERDPDEVYSILVELSYLDSPFIPKRQKELALQQSGERDMLVRIYGKRSTRVIAIYQDYNPDYHTVHYHDDSLNDGVARAMQANNWVPPASWTREIIVDPGTQKPALLKAAIPPPELWDHDQPYFIIYGEIFVRRLLPVPMAEMVIQAERNYQFERFIIDGHMARQKPPGFAETVGEQYEKAFQSVGLQSVQTGYSFLYGDDSFVRRSKQVISALQSRPCGRPQLRILNQACPNLVKQMKSNVRKTTPDGEPKEEAADNQVDDCRVCLEYWMSRRPEYKTPPQTSIDNQSAAALAYADKVNRFRAEQKNKPSDNTFHIGIPA